MKTLIGTLFAATLAVVAAPAMSSQNVDEIVVTVKQPTVQMFSDMTDEIVAETSADLRANQPAIAKPDVRVELSAPKDARK